MVADVNFNPFTGKLFLVEEIKQLDLDGDGKVSQSELNHGIAWLSGGADSENDVDLVTGSKAFEAAKKQGVTETVTTQDEFKNAMAIVVDEFKENYFNEHKGLTTEERKSTQAMLDSIANEFVSEYIAKNPQGPWNIKNAALEFENSVDASFKKLNDLKTANDSMISNYTENKDKNILSLIDITVGANENGNISLQEWNQMKSKAAQYLMGSMLNGEIDKTFLSALNENYETNEHYKAAMEAISKLKETSDPAEVQALLNDAFVSVTRFVEYHGKEQLATAVGDYQQVKAEEHIKTSLNSYIEAYKEQVITPEMSEADKAYLDKFLTTTVDKFVAKIAEAGDATTYTDVDLQQQFASYLQTALNDLISVQSRVVQETGSIETNYNNLVNVSNAAYANQNISDEEKAAIVDAAGELILSQLMNDVNDIAVLKELNSGYASSSEFKELQTTIATLKGSADAEEITKLEAKAKELVTKMLDKFSGVQLADAVNGTKPVEVTDDMKQKIINSSSIASDYDAATSRTTSRGKQNEGRLDEVQEMAKKDLEAIAEALKAQMKAELGSRYNEADVQKYIDDAINDTLAMFTQNVKRWNGHGNNNVKPDEQAFCFLRRSGTKKGRYVYNVQALVNTFLDNFNASSKQKHINKLDPSQATYDRENVIANSLGDDYWRNKSEKMYASRNDKATYAKLIEQAKTELKQVGEQLKISLLAEGVNLTSTEIDAIIEECLSGTITDMKNAFQYCQPSGSISGGGILASAATPYAALGVTAGLAKGVGAIYCASKGATAVTNALYQGFKVLNGASKFMSGALTTLGTAVPIVAGAVAIYTGLKSFTNLFGATYGKHNQDAGFYFERKSHSSKGNWGYDTKTVVDVFLAKIDQKIAEAKKKKEEEKVNSKGIS